MKYLYHILSISLFLTSFSNCAGGKGYVLDQDPPFTVASAFFQNWVAGVQGGGAGTKVSITLESLDERVLIKEIYYGEGVSETQKDPQNQNKYTANFLSQNNRDVIMDDSPTKESANTPPLKSPFNLERNEAVISYLQNGKMNYFKISNLEEKPVIAYPSVNSKGMN
ncbi:MAG: hypothetical protein R2793_09685 [Flavobacteriaceae bacterium]